MDGSVKTPLGIRVLSLMFAMIVAFILTLLVAFDRGDAPVTSSLPVSDASGTLSTSSGAPPATARDASTAVADSTAMNTSTTAGTSTTTADMTGRITDAATPLSGSVSPGAAWALLNVVFLGFSLVWSAVLLVSLLKGRGADGRGRGTPGGRVRAHARGRTDIKRRNHRRRLDGRVVVMAIGFVALLVFVLTENLRLPMTWVDSWSPLMAAFLIAQDAITLRLVARENSARETLTDDGSSFSPPPLLAPPMPLT